MERGLKEGKKNSNICLNQLYSYCIWAMSNSVFTSQELLIHTVPWIENLWIAKMEQESHLKFASFDLKLPFYKCYFLKNLKF